MDEADGGAAEGVRDFGALVDFVQRVGCSRVVRDAEGHLPRSTVAQALAELQVGQEERVELLLLATRWALVVINLTALCTNTMYMGDFASGIWVACSLRPGV